MIYKLFVWGVPIRYIRRPRQMVSYVRSVPTFPKLLAPIGFPLGVNVIDIWRDSVVALWRAGPNSAPKAVVSNRVTLHRGT